MKKKSKKIDRKKIIKRVEFWQSRMGMANWDIGITFENIKYAFETDQFKGVARTELESRYKIATIAFSIKELHLVDDNVIIHELLHCLLGEIIGYTRSNVDKEQHDKADDWIQYFEEKTISEIERILMRFYNYNKP